LKGKYILKDGEEPHAALEELIEFIKEAMCGAKYYFLHFDKVDHLARCFTIVDDQPANY